MFDSPFFLKKNNKIKIFLKKDIHVQTSNVLSEFLREIKSTEQVEYLKIAEILVKHINSRGFLFIH